MNFLRNSIMVLMLAALGTIWSCGGGSDPDPLTFLQRVSGTWTIASATEAGGSPSFSTSGFSLTINEDGTYSITQGSLPVEYQTNYANPVTAGSWTLQGQTGIIFDGSAATAVSIVSFSPTDDTQELTNMTISFTLDDKNATVIVFNLVKS